MIMFTIIIIIKFLYTKHYILNNNNNNGKNTQKVHCVCKNKTYRIKTTIVHQTRHARISPAFFEVNEISNKYK